MESGIWVGSIVLTRELAKEILVESGTYHFEFLVLSKSSIGQSLWVPELAADDESYRTTDQDGNEIDWPLFDHHKLSTNYDEPGIYNVMMIDWQGDIAYRLGVGEIHIDGWNMGHAVEKQILLG